MELAGLSCATAIAKTYAPDRFSKVLVCCGPGNNGGDGLVCARHLKMFNYLPTVIYPKKPINQLLTNLLHQVKEMDITSFQADWTEHSFDSYQLIVDAVFGFSFRPPAKDPYASLITKIRKADIPVVSVDIPSGWDVERGPLSPTDLQPDCLVSLTAPKKCAKAFKGRYHFLGGRFVPAKLEKKYAMSLPNYRGTCCVVDLKCL
ncbi:unnamed protein product [Soboliphyme baturini]|uniref:NAD(P)H-hydrate epimerase n=1 Tax=Soboliphyme baturini TaxID=241478 RepID=A0A183ITR6_9BILA|nr:unnamed protein product [Soboliphyme baturini]